MALPPWNRPLPAENNFILEQGSVFLISGGSGGIIRPIVEDLARATQGNFYLLDRVPLPAADDPDILRLASDREGLKNELITRLTRDGKKPTPVQVEGALFGIERSATTLQTLAIIEQLGGKAHYLACDVTDPALIDEAIQKIKDAEGHIDAFLHAAGMERSRKLEMKPIEEFRLVVSVKADGFFNLFKAMQAKDMLPRGHGVLLLGGRPLRQLRPDRLCRRQRPALQGRLGHAQPVSRPESRCDRLERLGRRGHGHAWQYPHPDEDGRDRPGSARTGRPDGAGRTAGQHGEAIIAGSLGALLEAHSPHGGMDLEKADSALRTGQPIHSMLSHVADFDLNRGLTLEADLDPKAQPYLYDHSMNGIPVLPGVMGIEGFSVAAKHIGSVLASSRDGVGGGEPGRYPFPGGIQVLSQGSAPGHLAGACRAGSSPGWWYMSAWNRAA